MRDMYSDSMWNKMNKMIDNMDRSMSRMFGNINVISAQPLYNVKTTSFVYTEPKTADRENTIEASQLTFMKDSIHVLTKHFKVYDLGLDKVQHDWLDNRIDENVDESFLVGVSLEKPRNPQEIYDIIFYAAKRLQKSTSVKRDVVFIDENSPYMSPSAILEQLYMFENPIMIVRSEFNESFWLSVLESNAFNLFNKLSIMVVNRKLEKIHRASSVWSFTHDLVDYNLTEKEVPTPQTEVDTQYDLKNPSAPQPRANYL